MAVDLDVGYSAAKFKSVCCKYSQSLETIVPNMDKGFYN